MLDTRDGTGRGGVTTPVTGGQSIDVTIAGVGPVPANAVGVILNVTGTEATAPDAGDQLAERGNRLAGRRQGVALRQHRVDPPRR